jgi:hypothetical protein
MNDLKSQHSLTFQFISFYNKSANQFFERVTQHLRELIYFFSDELKNLNNPTDLQILDAIICISMAFG